MQEHRLYVSGLHSSIKAKEVCERFASFGSVKDGEAGVTEMGLDANGTCPPLLPSASADRFHAQATQKLILFSLSKRRTRNWLDVSWDHTGMIRRTYCVF